MSDQPQNPILRQTIEAGRDRPMASEQQIVNRTLTRIVGDTINDGIRGVLKIVRLISQIGADESSEMAGVNRQGKLLAYNPNLADWEDTNTTLGKITDPNDLVWEAGYRAITIFDRQSGMRIPINPQHARIARTVKEENRDYPSRSSNPNVYGIKFLGVDFVKEAGNQAASYTPLDDTPGPDDWAYNIYDGPEDRYLVEGSEIVVYPASINGETRWFLENCCSTEDESSSSLSQSSVSISESSQSESSRGESSSQSVSASSQSEGSSLGLNCLKCLGTNDSQYKVTISDCGPYAGTYIVRYYSALGTCSFRSQDPADSSYPFVSMSLNALTNRMTVTLTISGSSSITWISSEGRIDCHAINETLNYFGGGCSPYSSGTVLVESL